MNPFYNHPAYDYAFGFTDRLLARMPRFGFVKNAHGSLHAQSIQNASDHIVDETETKLATLGADQTLVVNIGECHDLPNHILTEIQVMESLKERGIPFVFAHEAISNELNRVLESGSYFDDRFTEDDKRRISAYLADPNNAEVKEDLSRKVSFSSVQGALLSNSVLKQYLEDNDILHFNVDAATRSRHKQRDALLQIDPKTAAAIKKAAEIMKIDSPPPNVDVEETLGVVARNVHMVDACEELSQRIEDVKVILLITGRTHSTGSAFDDPHSHPYTGSIADIFDYSDQPHIVAGLSATEETHPPDDVANNKDVIHPRVLYGEVYGRNDVLMEDSYLTSISAHFTWLNESVSDKSPTDHRLDHDKSITEALLQIKEDITPS